MNKRITIIQGHPDSSTKHFGHAIAQAYIDGAHKTGHETRVIQVAQLNFSLLSSEEEFEHQPPSSDIQGAQDSIEWADHIVIIYPLWLGTMPAILKGFWEQALRPGFAMTSGDRNAWPRKLLKGRSARVIVTMGMPGIIYAWYYGAHSLKNLKRNILSFCGFAPIKHTIIGSVDNLGDVGRAKWLTRIERLGEQSK